MRIGNAQLTLINIAAVGWSISGEPAAARSLWTEVAHASDRPDTPPRPDDARAWSRVAAERSRQGAYEAALDATRRQMALGQLDSTVLGNGADLLMALGSLDEAIEQYREALTLDEREHDRNSRGDLQGRALIAFGLAAALDRKGEPVAAREAIGHALAISGAMAVLQRARQADGELFLVPPSDVFYVLGLAYEAQGRPDDAAAAFRSYLASPLPSGSAGATPAKYTQRARDHLVQAVVSGSSGGGAANPSREGGEPGRTRLRIVHEATVGADGPLVAPLIDAAWRLHARMLDTCLSDVPLDGAPAGASGGRRARDVRVRLEVTLDEDGGTRTVTAEFPAEVGASFGACIEEAVRTRFTTSRPTRRKPTRARIELLLAPPEPSGP